MMRHSVQVRGRALLRALACLLLAAAAGGAARAQDAWPPAGEADLLKGTTRKLDEYGKLRYCDESARLDNFALTLQNESGTRGYLLVYQGLDDMPPWKDSILNRPYDYLVSTRGIDGARLKVVDAGYREQRTFELWVVAADDPAPEPSNTVEVKIDRTKAYQWDEKGVEVEFLHDPQDEESQGEEGGDSDEQEAEAAADADEATAEAGAGAVDGEAAVKQTEAERAAEAEWLRETEKYEIAVERSGLIEGEDFEEEAAGAVAEPRDAEGEDGDAAVEPEPAPRMGKVKVTLWWNVESFAAELKAEPDSRACLVYYYGKKNADGETVRGLVARALVKLEEHFGVKGDRVVTVDGGYSPDPTVELWVLPRGAEPPKPKANKRRVVRFYSLPGEE